MSYEKIMAQYRNIQSTAETNHMTTEHDSAFAVAKKKDLRWYPWVGKSYHKTRILILGESTYHSGEETSAWAEFGKISTGMSRVLVSGKKGSLVLPESKQAHEHRPFAAMSGMFIWEAAGRKKYDISAVRLFWESVAFNNHCQEVVKGSAGGCHNPDQANSAFCETLKILKPKLCLVWGVGLTDKLSKMLRIKRCVCREHKIGSAYPRIINADGNRPPIIGLGHPSWAFSRGEWLNFLLKNEASKQPTTDLIDHLTNQLVE